MIKFFQKYSGFVWDGAMILLFFLYFRSNLLWTFNYFSQAASYEYLLLFLVALLMFFFSTRGKFSFKSREYVEWRVFLFLFGVILIDLLNVFFLHYQIVSASLMLLGVYALLGMYLKRTTWLRGFFLIGIVALSLPFVEHIQTFLGFPLRMFTAKLVSGIMGLLGTSSVTDAAVIITENNVTSIDVPCSGVKSLYTGMVVLLIVFFLKKVSFSLRMLLVAAAYFLLLLFFNVWRVFSLVYIYDVLDLSAFGDAIHIGIGVFGFAVSTYLLWWLVEKYLKVDAKREKDVNLKGKKIKKLYIIILLLLALLFEFSYVSFLSTEVEQASTFDQKIVFDVPGLNLQGLSLTEQEKSFFVKREIQFTKKYVGEMDSGRQFSLLLIASNSWKTHHNPEFCIQGIGHIIDGSEIIQFGDLRVRKLLLNNGKDTVFYWFVSGDRTVMDYSERVWAGINNSAEVWTLVEVGFQGSVDLDDPAVETLIKRLNSEVLSLFLLPAV
jgi:exosortase O